MLHTAIHAAYVPPRLLRATFVCLALAALPRLAGCGSTSETDLYGPGAYTLTGTMHQLDIEDGCWQFTGETGEQYELTGEKVPLLLRNGLSARLVVRDFPDVVTICMVGKLVEVLEILHTEQ